MDQKSALETATRFAVLVGQTYGNSKAFLFGSHARGNCHADSDIDVAVVLKDFENVLDIQLELMRLRRKIDSRIEPHPFRENEFKESNPMVAEILKYGKEIKH